MVITVCVSLCDFCCPSLPLHVLSTAYIEARAEMKATDRQRLISETRTLLKDILQSGELNGRSSAAQASSSSPNEEQSSSDSKEKQ